MAEFRVKSLWTKRLDIDVVFEEEERLRGEIRNSINRNFKNTTGGLANSFDVKTKSGARKGSKGVIISSDAPHALIHEYGGTVPERFPKQAKVLRFMAGSIEVFARHARAFHLPAKGYIEEAVDNWIKNYVDVKWDDKN
jgi:hypothetical protein